MCVLAFGRPNPNDSVISASDEYFGHTRVELGSVNERRVRQRFDGRVAEFLGVPYPRIYKLSIIMIKLSNLSN